MRSGSGLRGSALLAVPLALGVVLACAPRGPRRSGEVVAVPPPREDADAAAMDGGVASADASAPAEVTLSRAAAGEALSKLPRLSFLAPKSGEAIAPDKAESFLVRVDVKDWFASPGDHLHLVLDNRPYKALEDPAATIPLGHVVPNEPLAEGHHVLAVFAARADHSTAKPHDAPRGAAASRDGAPVAVVPFWIGKAGKTSPFKTADPMLLFSRPKGTYNGAAADGVLLDFYLSNAPLGEGRYAVAVTVTPPRGEALRSRLTRWEAMRIDGLPNGISRVRLDLLDGEGRPVPGPFGAIERDISVNRDAR